MSGTEYHEYLDPDTGETVWSSKQPEFLKWILRELTEPITVDIGGETWYRQNRFNGPGSLIVAEPGFESCQYFPDRKNLVVIGGRHDGVDIPAGIAAEVQLNMIVSYIAFREGSPTDIIKKSIETAQAIAVRGGTLKITDLSATLATPFRYLKKKGYSITFKELDLEDPEDYDFCKERSYHALHQGSETIGLLAVHL